MEQQNFDGKKLWSPVFERKPGIVIQNINSQQTAKWIRCQSSKLLRSDNTNMQVSQ
jgi:hypothetical protein